MSFGFYSDAGLTVPISSIRYYSTQIGDKVVYLGDPSAGRQLTDASNPGVTVMEVEVEDSASGSGLSTSAIKLASTSVGLGSAVAGEPLSIGHTVLSGPSNAVAIYIRFDTTGGVVGTDYTDLDLVVNNTIESDV
jgi:hypothetical protein